MSTVSQPAPSMLSLDMDERDDILDNIDTFIHGPHHGFIPFREEVIEKSTGVISERDLLSSTAPSPDSFLQWFSSFSSYQLDEAHSSWNIETSSGGARLFLTRSAIFDPSTKVALRDVRAIGYLCMDDSINYQDGLLGLCGHVQKVFMNQPTRLYLHGLYIRKSLVEAWTFDRSGIHCYQGFNWQEEFVRFSSLVLNYRFMTDTDLGMSDIIKTSEVGSYIAFDSTPVLSLKTLYLEDQTIALSEDIVGEATTCYRAKNLGSQRWEFVVKFKWRLASERPEEDLLQLAKEKNVWGVVSLDYHKSIDSTANLRRGFEFGSYRRFQARQDSIDESGANGIVKHTEETNKAFEDRVFTCVVISPAGRPLSTFKTRLELLQVLRDAIKAHRSLFQVGKILHQDVSANKIIITEPQRDGDPNGILIDLDVAMNLAIGTSPPSEVVGTRPFMSIGILKKRRHTYRHDLESFLYVFLRTVISNGNENPPETSRLREWNQGTWDESAKLKTHDMDKNHFANIILSEFLPQFHSLKPLAEDLRRILFPVQDGELWTGTNGSLAGINALYDGIIGAFEEAILREKMTIE